MLWSKGEVERKDISAGEQFKLPCMPTLSKRLFISGLEFPCPLPLPAIGILPSDTQGQHSSLHSDGGLLDSRSIPRRKTRSPYQLRSQKHGPSFISVRHQLKIRYLRTTDSIFLPLLDCLGTVGADRLALFLCSLLCSADLRLYPFTNTKLS